MKEKRCCICGVTYNTSEKQMTISTKEKNYCSVECLVRPKKI